MRSNVFEYTDYRDFLLSEIKRTKFSYARYAAKFPGVLSEDALKRLLSKGRGKLAFRGGYKMSDVRFANYLQAIKPKLLPSEIEFLTLLKLLNDSDSPGSRIQSKYHQTLNRLMNERKETKSGAAPPEHESYIYRALSFLPLEFRIRTEREIFTLLVRQMNRLDQSPESARLVRTIRKRIEKLDSGSRRG